MFILQQMLLGAGLAMDAFSVSLANGLNDTEMKKRKLFLISGTFAFFQALMPMLGWICVHTVIEYFSAFEKFIPYIALLLLLYIGGKMLIEGIKQKSEEEISSASLTFTSLLVQGVATSIDALSVGFTIAEYDFLLALIASLIIASVTFIICSVGVMIGKKFGTRLAGKATVLGGIILIAIGLEIFISGVFF